ncbi:MAG: U32 family peptidase [Spirochaeta sp.]|jgi:putative protease|nr:U32 family peptidase [Spirochaeta sp.]
MELLSPAGSLEKLRIAYRYGADAAYIGIGGFSLRSSADTIAPERLLTDDKLLEDTRTELRRLKATAGRPRRLYATLNLFAHEHDLRDVKPVLTAIRELPIDALIVADIGLVEPIRHALPEMKLHLSTQANCTNSGAARVYRQLGFSRIVAARELSLSEIAAIKAAVPEMEIEVFAHGAMCMSYSGRCFLSAAMTGRSANRGDCAHSCRWNYAVVEEQRPGEYWPIEEDGRFSTILSSRDLMLYDHIGRLRDAGVTSLKIEGRMKSALYTAITTGAYRHAVDAAAARETTQARDRADKPADRPLAAAVTERWRSLLDALSHRPYTAGFAVGDESVHVPAERSGPTQFRLMGIVRERVSGGASDGAVYRVETKNAIHREQPLSILTPDGVVRGIPRPELFDDDGAPVPRIIQGHPGFIRLGTGPAEMPRNDDSEGNDLFTDAILLSSPG